MPTPGTRVSLSASFAPPVLKGIKVYPENPFLFDFILDNGQSGKKGDTKEAGKLVKYFLASLTTPENDMWVNLSPYEKDRIVPESFGQTEMGRDLLAQDYILKQITASLIYPEDDLGKKFWDRVYAEAKKKFGTIDIPINTFNKVWIVPAKAVVYENPQTSSAYVIKSALKVMLEEDYLAMQKNLTAPNPLFKKEGESNATQQTPSLDNQRAEGVLNTHSIGSQIVREIVIPALTKEVNEGKNFSQLRQIYNSLILAAWYKKKIKDSILNQVYIDKNKFAGINIDDPNEKQIIYDRYLEAFKKGAYNYIKEEIDPATQEAIPKKYFSGGFSAQKFLVGSALEITDNSSEIAAASPIPEGERVRVELTSSSSPTGQEREKAVYILPTEALHIRALYSLKGFAARAGLYKLADLAGRLLRTQESQNRKNYEDLLDGYFEIEIVDVNQTREAEELLAKIKTAISSLPNIPARMKRGFQDLKARVIENNDRMTGINQSKTQLRFDQEYHFMIPDQARTVITGHEVGHAMLGTDETSLEIQKEIEIRNDIMGLIAGRLIWGHDFQVSAFQDALEFMYRSRFEELYEDKLRNWREPAVHLPQEERMALLYKLDQLSIDQLVELFKLPLSRSVRNIKVFDAVANGPPVTSSTVTDIASTPLSSGSEDLQVKIAASPVNNLAMRQFIRNLDGLDAASFSQLIRVAFPMKNSERDARLLQEWEANDSHNKVKSGGGIIFRKVKGQWAIMFLKRGETAGSDQGKFNLPSGGIESGETFVGGALREIWEETGFNLGEPLGQTPFFTAMKNLVLARFMIFVDESDRIPQGQLPGEVAGYGFLSPKMLFSENAETRVRDIESSLGGELVDFYRNPDGFASMAGFFLQLRAVAQRIPQFSSLLLSSGESSQAGAGSSLTSQEKSRIEALADKFIVEKLKPESKQNPAENYSYNGANNILRELMQVSGDVAIRYFADDLGRKWSANGFDPIYGSIFDMVAVLCAEFDGKAPELRKYYEFAFNFLEAASPRQRTSALRLMVLTLVNHLRDLGIHPENDERQFGWEEDKRPVDLENLFGSKPGDKQVLARYFMSLLELPPEELSGFIYDQNFDIPYFLKYVTKNDLRNFLGAILGVDTSYIASDVGFGLEKLKIFRHFFRKYLGPGHERIELEDVGAELLARVFDPKTLGQANILRIERVLMAAMSVRENDFTSNNMRSPYRLIMGYFSLAPLLISPEFWGRARSLKLDDPMTLLSMEPNYFPESIRHLVELQANAIPASRDLLAQPYGLRPEYVRVFTSPRMAAIFPNLAAMLMPERNDPSKQNRPGSAPDAASFNAAASAVLSPGRQQELNLLAEREIINNLTWQRNPNLLANIFYSAGFPKQLTKVQVHEEIDFIRQKIKTLWDEKSLSRFLGQFYTALALNLTERYEAPEIVRGYYEWVYKFLDTVSPVERAQVLWAMIVSHSAHMRGLGLHHEVTDPSVFLDQELLLGEGGLLQRYVRSVSELTQSQMTEKMPGPPGTNFTREDLMLWGLMLAFEPTIYTYASDFKIPVVNAALQKRFGDGTTIQTAAGRFLKQALAEPGFNGIKSQAMAMLKKALAVSPEQWRAKGMLAPEEFELPQIYLQNIIKKPGFFAQFRDSGVPDPVMGFAVLTDFFSDDLRQALTYKKIPAKLKDILAGSPRGRWGLYRSFYDSQEMKDIWETGERPVVAASPAFENPFAITDFDSRIPKARSPFPAGLVQKNPETNNYGKIFINEKDFLARGDFYKVINYQAVDHDGMPIKREILEEMIRREANALFALRRAGVTGVPEILEYGFTPQGEVYLLLRGMPGSVALRSGDNLSGFTLGEKVIFFRKLVEIVLKTHQNHVSQNDIKFENVIIDPRTKSPMLIDFGGSEALTPLHRLHDFINLLSMMVGSLRPEEAVLLTNVFQVMYDHLAPGQSYMDVLVERLREVERLVVSSSTVSIDEAFELKDFDPRIPKIDESVNFSEFRFKRLTEDISKSDIYYDENDFKETGDFYKVINFNFNSYAAWPSLMVAITSQYKREANVIFALNKAGLSGIPAILGYGVAANGAIFLKMRGFPDSRALTSKTNLHGYSFVEKLEFFRVLAGILADLHEHNVVHNDVRFNNLIIGPESKNPVLIDLGRSEPAGLEGILKDIAWLQGMFKTALGNDPQEVDAAKELDEFLRENYRSRDYLKKDFTRRMALKFSEMENKVKSQAADAKAASAVDVRVTDDYKTIGDDLPDVMSQIKEVMDSVKSNEYSQTYQLPLLESLLLGKNIQDTHEYKYALAYDTMTKKIIGYVLFRYYSPESGLVFISSLEIHNDYQRNSIGLNLMKNVFDFVRTHGYIGVSIYSSPDGVSFYSNLDQRISGIKRRIPVGDTVSNFFFFFLDDQKGTSSAVEPPGGIDFQDDKLNLETQTGNRGDIQFDFDPVQLQKLQNVPGFTPIIIQMQPLTDVRMFLGIKENPKTSLAVSSAS